MKIEVRNTGLDFTPEKEGEDEAVKNFRDATAFRVEGAEHTHRFAYGLWDGREYLVESNRDGSHWAPFGLLHDALDEFPSATFVDLRRKPNPTEHIDLEIDPAVIPSMRDYQIEAVSEALFDDGLLTGKGMLNLPTGAGKTVLAADIICKIGQPTLFIVQSDELMRQTVRFFKKAIKAKTKIPKGYDPLIAQFGGGKKEVGFITIASVQAMTVNYESVEVRELLETCDVTFFDECHHLEGGSAWRTIILLSDSFYKLGMSATIYLDRKRGMPKGSIWMVGATGPIIYKITPSELIERGWLCRPVIKFVTAPFPDGHFLTGPYPDVYYDGIMANDQRNELIAEIAAYETKKRKKRLLITISKTEHLEYLVPKLKLAGLLVAVSIGKTTRRQREHNVELLKTRKCDVLVATILSEAVDLPWLETVLIADGGKSKKAAMQKLRNTRTGSLIPVLPPPKVNVYVFADFCSNTLQKHSLAQLREYREHPAFRIQWVQRWTKSAA